MKVALVNPRWSFEGSMSAECKEPHLPLEYGYARALLGAAGHEAQIFDAHLCRMTLGELRAELEAFAPDMSVITTAPSYPFWRTAPPELRVPMETLRALRPIGGTWVAVGPHGSTTPRATLTKLDLDAVVVGECEDVLTTLAGTSRDAWGTVPSLAYREGDEVRVQGPAALTSVDSLLPLEWDARTIALHRHHHDRFDGMPCGPGAELEASRGTSNDCGDRLRTRPLEVVLDELDGLIGGGVHYVYFIDEHFVPDRALLEALAARDIIFGVQTRIDAWTPAKLDLLGRAGCVSMGAGVESELTFAELTELLVRAKRSIPFVQANLLGTADDEADVLAWRAHLRHHGIWSTEPLPRFPFPAMGAPPNTEQASVRRVRGA